jgi:hypothetical protein
MNNGIIDFHTHAFPDSISDFAFGFLLHFPFFASAPKGRRYGGQDDGRDEGQAVSNDGLTFLLEEPGNGDG